MPITSEQRATFLVDGSKAVYLPCPAGASVTIFNQGNTVYFKSTSDVTSSSSDGSLATATSGTFTAGKYLICATGVATSVFSVVNESVSTNSTVPYGIGTWQPIAATSGTDTACTNGTAYAGSVPVPRSVLVTGVNYLIGSVGTVTKVIASIHDINGNPIASSALAGATVGTAANSQQVALTAAITLPGPATYFAALTFDGTNAKFRTVPAFCNVGNGVVGNGVTQTFGTLAAFTAPTTFTADKVPVLSLY